ncbi:MAG: methyltransferase domain-containing protein [Chloroflexota bacterium]|nr:methyltransferase domain-containing protein [Chloroflexota bacterium]
MTEPIFGAGGRASASGAVPTPDPAERLHRLRNDIQDRVGALEEVSVLLPRAKRRYLIARPTDTEALLDHAEGDPEQNLPYWSELWPSGIALADAIAKQPDAVRGRRVLELGSGLGVTAIAALQAGADLFAADYSPESLLLCRRNALANAGREPATLELNWRRPEPALFDASGDGYPVVLAADVLYEGRDVDPLLALIERLVAPGGFLWLAEPGRPVARRFLEAARGAGWRATSRTHPGPWPDPKDDWVVVAVHMLRRVKPERA